MTNLSLVEKRHLARALFEEATGHPTTGDWRDISERNLDILIYCFKGMIENDERVLRLLSGALRTKRQ